VYTCKRVNARIPTINSQHAAGSWLAYRVARAHGELGASLTAGQRRFCRLLRLKPLRHGHPAQTSTDEAEFTDLTSVNSADSIGRKG